MSCKKAEFWLMLLISALLIIFLAPSTLDLGEFVDGLTYARISLNMANSWGNFWHMHYTQTFGKLFFSQPPLDIWFGSLWFKTIGNILILEKIYSFVWFLLTIIALSFLWKHISGQICGFWLVLVLWVISPIVLRMASQNILDVPLEFFTILTVLFYLKAFENKWYIVLSSISFIAAFFTKGVAALFILLMFPLSLFLGKKFKQIIDLGLIFSTVILIISVFIYFNPDAKTFWTNYYHQQVLQSLKNVRVTNNRFSILFIYFEYTFYMWIIIIGVLFTKQADKQKLRYIFFFSLLSFIQALQFIVSFKQRAFYILPSISFLALASALGIYKKIDEKISVLTKNNWFKTLTTLAVLFAIYMSFSCFGKIYRDKKLVQDVLTLKHHFHDQIFCASLKIKKDWDIYAYLYRYAKISLNTSTHCTKNYYLTLKSEHLPQNYKCLYSLNILALYKKTKAPSVK